MKCNVYFLAKHFSLLKTAFYFPAKGIAGKVEEAVPKIKQEANSRRKQEIHGENKGKLR